MRRGLRFVIGSLILIVMLSAIGRSGSDRGATPIAPASAREAAEVATSEPVEPSMQHAGRQQIAQQGRWRPHQWRDEMSDFDNIRFSVEAENTIPSSFRLGQLRPVFVFRCQDNRTAAYVDWQRFITTGRINDGHRVRFRIDDRSPVTAQWKMSTNYEATGLWRGRAIPFLRELLGAERLIVETVPHGDNVVRANFDSSGIDEAITQISERCGW